MAPEESEVYEELSRKCGTRSTATFWEEIWEAGPYYDRISELLDQSKHYAIFVGWQLDSRLPLRSPDMKPEPLRAKLLRLCEEKPDFHVYLLMWDHAYFYMLERELGQMLIWRNAHPRIHLVFDNRHPFGGSHHEKICIIDGEIALCGGIDLCDRRWDSPLHLYEDPRRSLDGRKEHHGPYHDLAVEVKGPICTEIHKHVAQRWKALSPTPFPNPIPMAPVSGSQPVLLSRTQASIDGAHPRPLHEIQALFRELILGAQDRILLEGQYFWSQEIRDLLVARMMEKHSRSFEVILILTDLEKAPTWTRFMARHERALMDQLVRAARFSGCTLKIGSPYVRPPEAIPGLLPKPVYVHSKVLLVDDRYFSLGSANFAARAMNLDTELQLTRIASTASERSHLHWIARKMESHWNLENSPAKSMSFIPYSEERAKSPVPIVARVPFLAALYDPASPWMEPVKKALGAWVTEPGSRPAFPIPRWIFGIAALALGQALGLAVLSSEAASRALTSILFAALASIWILPLPFVPLLLAISALSPQDALIALVSALWLDAILGYGFARVFPTRAARVFKMSARSSAQDPSSERTVLGMLRLVLNPVVPLRRKIAVQGLRFIPLPWYIAGTGLILPAALGVVLIAWIGLLGK